MTAGVGTSMFYSGITSTLAERRRNGFPRHGRKGSAIALKSLSRPRPPAGYGAAEAILVRPAIKGVAARECLE
jgi:hypothetical protein